MARFLHPASKDVRNESAMRTTGGATLVVAALAACACNPPPVPVEGRPADLEALVGEWRGEYYPTRTAGSLEPDRGAWKVRRVKGQRNGPRPATHDRGGWTWRD